MTLTPQQHDLNAPAKTGAELLVQALVAEGVEYIFGVPGGAILPILDVLADGGPEFILCRDETGAAFMAQAYGRITSRPGVVITTSGPGLINAVCGVATAHEDRDPLVIITGHVSQRMQLRPTHMNLDTAALFKPITKWSVEIEDADTIPEAICNAFRLAATDQKGAVHLSIPVNISTASVTHHPLPKAPPPPQGAASPLLLSAIAKRLESAERPTILLGVRAGTPRVAEAVRRFMSKCKLPAVMTFEAAGTLSRDHLSQFAGRVGYIKNQPGDALLTGADLVLTIGYDAVEYDPTEWLNGSAARVIHLDSIPAVIDTFYQPEMEVIGDIALNLDHLAATLKKDFTDPRSDVALAREALVHEQSRGESLDGFPIHPLRFIHALRNCLDDDITVTCDVGAHEIWMARYFFCYQPRHLLFSMGHQTMGVAMPWAITAALVRKDHKSISVSGDGSFMMTVMELETAVRLRLNTIHIIWVDQAYNLIESLQNRQFGRHFGCRFGPIDFVGLAEALGAIGLRITAASEIERVLQAALAAKGPVVIEVPIDYSDNVELVATLEASALH